MTTAVSEQFDTSTFRAAFQRVPTGVSIITTHTPDGPVGMVVGTFMSVSLDPPLVGFYAMKGSRSWRRLKVADRFGVNILAHDQADLCREFATDPARRFAAGWQLTGDGCPRVDDAVVWIECSMDRVYSIGDHDLAVGRIEEILVARDTRPLIFNRGAYTAPADQGDLTWER